MQNRVNAILSILILVFFIPATLGFALIDHYCSGCQSHQTETTFLVSAHQHDDASCSCAYSGEAESKHDYKHEDACNGDYSPLQHKHDCVVDLKILEEPFTPGSIENWLPAPLEISFATLFFTSNQIPPEAFSANTAHLLFAPPNILSGNNRLVLNEVFRL